MYVLKKEKTESQGNSPLVCQLQGDVHTSGSAGDLKQQSKISLVCYTRVLPKTREGKTRKTKNKVMK